MALQPSSDGIRFIAAKRINRTAQNSVMLRRLSEFFSLVSHDGTTPIPCLSHVNTRPVFEHFP
jgi:hypothetical protein